MSGSFTFGKKEKLSHYKQIDQLFDEGSSFNLKSFRVFYLLRTPPEKVPVKVMVAIPKKKFRRAVDRNRLRRQIREAYRLNKHMLDPKAQSVTSSICIGFVYIGDQADVAYAELENQMIACLEKIEKILSRV